MKRLAIPLASYLAVTIVVPILNGAPTDASFLEHSALAVILPLIIMGTLSPLLTSRNRAVPAARVAAPKALGPCDLRRKVALESAACPPGNRPPG